ncbi:3'-5' exonuclease [Streptococcus himalayensis]|uniref:3'-5' exonuclease n=1 Tax=Streptococcus himalayensis TaxID=1888195 RepID=A0A917A981_9STRE|nr:3'-5' exonuclease [Streptococcus himalayensis]GGE34819.1 3'-5' exonuclease [Streptococcus himalayensis]
MEHLGTYIAFDLEFTEYKGQFHLIQVSAVKMQDGLEVGQFDSYVHTDVPLKSFINGLTGITSEHLLHAPSVGTVLADFQQFIGETALIGYNGKKSDIPILLENGLDVAALYQVDVYEEALERRSTDLHGIANLRLATVASFLGLKGRAHNSLEDARMTAQIYEKFKEVDESKSWLNEQDKDFQGTFNGLDLSAFFGGDDA